MKQFVNEPSKGPRLAVLLTMMLCLLSTNAKTALSIPNRVTIVTEEMEQEAIRHGQTYRSDDVTVTLCNKAGGLTFSLQSPTKPVKAVKVRWNKAATADALYLGDHWERGYGDLEWKTLDASRVMPWYYMEYDGKHTRGYGVTTGCRTMCSWQVSAGYIELTMDTRSGSHGVKLADRQLEMATVVTCQSEKRERPFQTLRRFCQTMCPNPRLPKQPVYGINDWYFAYGNNSDSLILKTVEMVSDLVPQNGNRPYCLIDAGWACIAPGKTSANCWSDNFYTPGPHFKDMKQLATEIKRRGMRPGLWMRPLCAPYGAPERRLMPKYERTDSPDDRILDPTVEENREYIRKCFRTYQEWGYEMVKHDFSTVDILGKWGFEMMRDGDITQDDWQFHRQDMTTAEVFLQLYRDIREAAGDICLIGCNTISHLAAGIFELQRIGDDTSGKEWERTRKMGVNSLAFRAAQHNTFYAADADCVGLTTDIDWQKNKQWMQLLAYSGTPLFISAQPEALGEEQRAFIRQCFKQASEQNSVGEPVDWLSTLTPKQWMLDGNITTFNW